jgi:hypothetical protein
MAGFTGPVSNNALINNFYQLEISTIPNTTWFCQAANLPGIKFYEVDQPTILSHPIRSPVGAIRFDDFGITFKVDENLKNWLEIHNWIKRMSNYTNDTSFSKPWNEQRSNGSLRITNSAYTPILEINFTGLFPTELGGLVFTTVEPDSKELMSTVKFAYADYDVRIFENP